MSQVWAEIGRQSLEARNLEIIPLPFWDNRQFLRPQQIPSHFNSPGSRTSKLNRIGQLADREIESFKCPTVSINIQEMPIFQPKTATEPAKVIRAIINTKTLGLDLQDSPILGISLPTPLQYPPSSTFPSSPHAWVSCHSYPAERGLLSKR